MRVHLDLLELVDRLEELGHLECEGVRENQVKGVSREYKVPVGSLARQGSLELRDQLASVVILDHLA